jgi:metal-dependent HD superfamily phosphatase/phosphodiesterase
MGVTVSRDLLRKHVLRSNLLRAAYEALMSDVEVRTLLHMSNIMAVHRLRFNDHGPVHAEIVAGAALELFDRLVASGVEPTTVRDGTAPSMDHARLVVMYAAILHDIGNAVHRDMHEKLGAVLARDIVDRALSKIVTDVEQRVMLRQEILHAIHSTAYDVDCLSLEAGVVKVADGLDMAEGRARLPYRLGKLDMHAVSALSIKRVEIDEGLKRPIAVVVHMSDMAGLFQVERVLMPKLRTSGLEDRIEVYINVAGEQFLRVHPS